MEKVKELEKGDVETKETKAPIKEAGSSFSKEQLLASERFRNERDIVDALLLPDKTYTVEQVEKMIKKYKKGTVR